jgi:hypothetical protein
LNFSTACFEHFNTLHGLFTACSRPSIFHRKIFFSTACFELFGGGHGHLATLFALHCPDFALITIDLNTAQ